MPLSSRAGNVVEVQEDNPSGLANRTVVNTYDDVYRLVNESTTEAGGGTVSVTYGYDDASNRSQKVVVGGPTPGTTDYTYNSINQLTGWTDGTNTVSYTYDLNSNRESRTQGADSDALSWDYENRLITFDKNTGDGQGLYTFAYDYRTRRIETAKDADPVTTFVFSGGTSVQELEGGVLAVEFVRGSDMGGGVGGMLYSLRSGARSFTHYNARGDVVAKTDGAGVLTYQAAYEAWGEIKAESGSTLDRQKSNSKDRDVPGYANEGFRYRDLETGTFLSKDPLGFVDGPNLYAYVMQNPWTSFDPEGLDTKVVTKTVGEKQVTTFTITGVVIDRSGQDFTVKRSDGVVHRTHQQELETYTKYIEEGVRRTFTGGVGNHSWKADVQLRLVKSEAEIAPKDLIYKIIYKTDTSGVEWDKIAGISDYGSKIITVQSPSVRTGPSAIAGHETGHNLGLRHPNLDGTTGLGRDSLNPIPGLGLDNFMSYGHGHTVDPRQIKLIQYYFDQGDLNGAHYDSDGKWKSEKSQAEIFGKQRFEGKDRDGRLPFE